MGVISYIVDTYLRENTRKNKDGSEVTYVQLAHKVFQIEASIGLVTSIAEMLFQDRRGLLRLLPALPSSWSREKVDGLRARGGYSVNIEWKDNKLTKAGIVPFNDRQCVVKSVHQSLVVKDLSGNSVPVKRGENRIVFDVEGGQSYTLTCE